MAKHGPYKNEERAKEVAKYYRNFGLVAIPSRLSNVDKDIVSKRHWYVYTYRPIVIGQRR